MHQQLKFSFGHILAFIALLFYGYITFMSVTYYLGGNYIVGGIVAGGIALMLLLLLFRLQLLKGVNHNFERNIVYERLMLVAFTLVCAAAFVPYSHFWTVRHHEKEITSRFSESLETLDDLFDGYDDYAKGRLNVLDATLSAMRQDSPPDNPFEPTSINGHIATVKGLLLQLQPESYQELRDEADEWIRQSKKTVSIWNVFLMGNIRNISKSLNSWHSLMSDLSEHVTKYEPEHTEPFNYEQLVSETTDSLQSVVPLYRTTGTPQPMAWITGIITLLLLYTPWAIQRRSPRNPYNLFRRRKQFKGRGGVIDVAEHIDYVKRAGTLDHNDKHNNHKEKNNNVETPKRQHRAQSL